MNENVFDPTDIFSITQTESLEQIYPPEGGNVVNSDLITLMTFYIMKM